MHRTDFEWNFLKIKRVNFAKGISFWVVHASCKLLHFTYNSTILYLYEKVVDENPKSHQLVLAVSKKGENAISRDIFPFQWPKNANESPFFVFTRRMLLCHLCQKFWKINSRKLITPHSKEFVKNVWKSS